jgi:hypothetical protein
MFGSIKKAMVAGAVVAAGALAGPAMASAAFPTWNGGGGAAEGAGQLTLAVGTSTTTCDVAFTADLSNGGTPTMGQGQVTSFLLGVPAGGACTTNVPGCSVTAVANTTTPWAITATTIATPQRLQISGISFTNTYAGASCPLNGVNVAATGSLEGNYDSSTGVLSFNNEPGLTSSLGAATVTGSVEIAYEATGLPPVLS